ncbi:MAG TPA: hypothetical protein VFU43_20890 [Streptosporangiaceae bacterium]|nr:hypothetical protein [Streptosporangiaceae bacterium]
MLTAVLVPVIVVWAYAAVELHALACRRGRRGVRSSALRARAALIVGTLFAGAAAVATAIDAGHGRPAPLLLLPAAAAVRLTLPRLSGLIQRLYADPWGPSDPPIRRAAASPALAVPARSALLGALVAGLTPTWTAAAAVYAGAAAAAGGMVLDARRRRARLARRRTGTLARVLVGAPAPPVLTDPAAVGRTRFTSGVTGRRPAPAGRRPCPYRTSATHSSPATS